MVKNMVDCTILKDLQHTLLLLPPYSALIPLASGIQRRVRGVVSRTRSAPTVNVTTTSHRHFTCLPGTNKQNKQTKNLTGRPRYLVLKP
uniref:Uncharacterized protein n=1 Tax=Anguilla anguilla TaxID=7936 RepID=A0A0E9UBC1_ANGAN